MAPSSGHREAPAGRARGEFPLHQTHGIALWDQHRLLADSRDLGWHDAYTSLATEQPWQRTLHALPHLCVALCRHRPAQVSRRIDGEGAPLQAQLRPRLLGIVPAGRESHWSLQGQPDIQLVYLRRGMVEQVAAEVLGLDAAAVELAPRLAFADPLAEHLMEELLQLARHDHGGADGLYADALARTLALHLLRHGRAARSGAARGQPARADARMRHVCHFIEHALAEDLSLARLAAEAGLGADAFAEAFRRSVGETPHRYVLRQRVERAKQLLRARALPVAEVALQCGFASQSHLATVFKRSTGATPREYRSGAR